MLRLLYVALTSILVNLWVYLLWQAVSATQRGGRQGFQARFPLKTMLSFIRGLNQALLGLKIHRAIVRLLDSWVGDRNLNPLLRFPHT